MARPPAEGEDLDSRPVAHPPPEAIVEEQIDNRIRVLEESLQADALAFLGRIIYGVDDVIRDAIEAIENKRKSLAVILETTGGYIEVTQRIADTFRHHYTRVEFLVPNFAMSAGTGVRRRHRPCRPGHPQWSSGREPLIVPGPQRRR